MEILSFSVSTPFWIWLLFALTTAYYYDIMKRRIARLEQKILVDEAELTNGILKIKLYKQDIPSSPKKIIEIIEE